MDSRQHQLIEQCAVMIAQADGLIISAGAGMGVDSGMPDFRGDKGFWATYPALGRGKIHFQDIACPDAFHDNPALAWGFYGHRMAMYRDLQPHAGFSLLKKWGEKMRLGYHVFTSNVDGHFQKAGFADHRIYECHGSIHYLQCLTPCCNDIWPAADFIPVIDTEKCLLLNSPPRCKKCGGIARPNILMFGDWGWNEQRSAQQLTLLDHCLQALKNPLVIEIGAGTAVPSVRLFGEKIVRKHKGKMIRINLREPDIDPVFGKVNGISLAMGGLAALTAIDNAIHPDLPAQQ